MCSQGSINNRTRTRAAAAALTVVLASSVVGCGLAGDRPAQKWASGTVDLNALARLHPAWSQVLQFDETLVRLRDAQHVLAPTRQGLFPRLGVTAYYGRVEAPTIESEPEDLKLMAVEKDQIAALEHTRSLVRAQQIDLQRDTWDRQADENYAHDVAKADAEFLTATRKALGDSDDTLLNLALQINALGVTIANLKALNSPDTVVAQVQAELDARRAEERSREADTNSALASALIQLRRAVDRAKTVRDAYTSDLAQQLDKQLRTEDDLQVAAVARGLTREREALMSVEKDLMATDLPPAGTLGPEYAPQAGAPRAISPASASAAAATLDAAGREAVRQRQRWMSFVYDDTRAAALDMAEKRHWRIRFSRAKPGESDLTGPMAKALETGVWST